MLSLIKKFIQVRQKTLLIYITICALLMWLYVVFFPHMYEQAETLSEAFQSYPDAFMKAFNVNLDQLFLSLEAFLAAEQFSLMWPIILIVLITSLGSSALAGEVDTGTIEILLSQPLSRTKIFFAKYISGVIIIALFIFGSVFSVIPFAALHNVDFQINRYFTISILGFLFALAIFSLSMMVSAWSSRKGLVSSITAGTILGMYALNLVSSFKESVENLKYVSFFYYFDSNAALIDNKIEPLSIIVFITFSIICTLAGVIFFKKRDVAT